MGLKVAKHVEIVIQKKMVLDQRMSSVAKVVGRNGNRSILDTLKKQGEIKYLDSLI